jgi:hypothetical protein
MKTLKQAQDSGALAALQTFKLADGGPGFLGGQWQAMKELPGHLRGGLGGQLPQSLQGVGHLAEGLEGPVADLGELSRQRAMGNIRTLLPSMAVGGGLYMLHRHQQAKQQAAQAAHAAQAAQMQQMMGGQQGGY